MLQRILAARTMNVAALCARLGVLQSPPCSFGRTADQHAKFNVPDARSGQRSRSFLVSCRAGLGGGGLPALSAPPSFSNRFTHGGLDASLNAAGIFTSASAQRPTGRVPRATTDKNSSQRGTQKLDPKIAAKLPQYCSGCGIKMQRDDPNDAGYFVVPKRFIDETMAAQSHPAREAFEEELSALLNEDESAESLPDRPEGGTAEELEDWDAAFAEAAMAEAVASADTMPAPAPGAGQTPVVWGAFESMVDSWADEAGVAAKVKVPQTAQIRKAIKAEAAAGVPVQCARCHSLTHYGAVKVAAAEAQIPAFDLGRKVGRKIAATPHRRAVVACVVDLADFDGSLPRAALAACIPREFWDDATAEGPQYLEGGFRLVVVANKADLLPRQMSRPRIEQWVRKRCRQGGLPRLSAVHLVSSVRGTGVPELLVDLHKIAGQRGDVWVVGAQNAGKSSLINAMRKEAGFDPARNLTTASMPGTTLGMLKVEGLMPERSMMFDTPGVPHAHQLTTQLEPEEVKLLLPRKALKPRSYRIGAGYSILLGGVVRVDVVKAPAATIYLTAWASQEVVTHFGKTDAALERQQKHAGSRLTPPLGDEKRIARLPELLPTDIAVEGKTFRESTTDIAIAGLGWIGVAVKGQSNFRVWAPLGVAVTTRESLAPDLAPDMQRPGFSSDSGASTSPGKSQGRQQQPRSRKRPASAARR
mmetsp:Transcript_1792/g.5215  ORF Transcript_1792/g.5215 Transcript_1792/m.5215 type:complete len:701 (+) Transcript_1792:224-2326(+)